MSSISEKHSIGFLKLRFSALQLDKRITGWVKKFIGSFRFRPGLKTKLFDIFLPILHLDWCFLSPPLKSRGKKLPAKSITPMIIGEPFRWPFFSFFSTYHSSLAHSTVEEGTEALKCNSWWFLLRPFFCIFFHVVKTIIHVSEDRKISCLYVVMSCCHDDSISFSFSSVLRLFK